jgi:5'(3')-deoxyribonucleotidase
MPYVSVDIDIDEVLGDLNSRELQELVDNLYDDGWVPTQIKAVTDSASISDEEWNEVIEKLRTGKIFLTIEEEELIKQLAKKL